MAMVRFGGSRVVERKTEQLATAAKIGSEDNWDTS
jgi:hypothetical protein